ncbi:hypothetical protein BaRGS_00012495 [Batillaria attramentaria]|uniref:Uncharacterized protein n=1 Tax=Batillaria attramentaria TaxID=370345 RepID=A0ABD0LAS6_9CAEN
MQGKPKIDSSCPSQMVNGLVSVFLVMDTAYELLYPRLGWLCDFTYHAPLPGGNESGTAYLAIRWKNSRGCQRTDSCFKCSPTGRNPTLRRPQSPGGNPDLGVGFRLHSARDFLALRAGFEPAWVSPIG